jgi:hypothetical protein
MRFGDKLFIKVPLRPLHTSFSVFRERHAPLPASPMLFSRAVFRWSLFQKSSKEKNLNSLMPNMRYGKPGPAKLCAKQEESCFWAVGAAKLRQKGKACPQVQASGHLFL